MFRSLNKLYDRHMNFQCPNQDLESWNVLKYCPNDDVLYALSGNDMTYLSVEYTIV